MKKYRLVCIALLLCLALSGCGSKAFMMPFSEEAGNAVYEPGTVISSETTSGSAVNASGSSVSLMAEDLCVIDGYHMSELAGNPEFNAKAVFVVNDEGNSPLYVKHCFKRLYPASLTKLMTALVAYKYCDDLERTFTVTEDCLKLPDPYAKKMGIQVGDTFTIHDLLRATLIPSYNDAAKALAFAVAGSEENFVKLMNEEAKNIGATRSNFTNCHGLHDKNHYTTLYDLYLMFHELMKNDDFVNTVGNGELDINYNDTYGNTKTKQLISTDQFLTGGATLPEGITVVGGKTGTTDEAGACMLLYIRDSAGNGYYAGILGASDHINLYAGFSTIFNSLPGSAIVDDNGSESTEAGQGQ